MSSFLCFICHNTVNADTVEETREKYKEVVGINLCPDSHLCYICCHLVNKLWRFKSMCLKRSLEYPVLFSEKCSISLHIKDIETQILCLEETCQPNGTNDFYFRYTDNRDQSNDYVELEDERNNEDIPENDSTNVATYSEHKYLENVKQESIKMEYDNVNDSENNDCYSEVNDIEDESEELKVEYEDSEVLDVTADVEPEPGSSKPKKSGKKGFKKILLCLEEQKSELEAQRKGKKYLEAEFKCYNCALGFLFKDSYQAHMMRHEESNGEHLCQLCTLRFASAAVLRAHSVMHKERYVCSCGTVARKRQMHTHARKCHKKEQDSAACHLCGHVFQDASGLQQHLKRFHMTKTRNRSYSCNVCGKSYNNQAAVRTHMIKHIQRKFSCDQCASNFSSPYTLTQHKKKHLINIDNKEHMCVTCGVGYTTRKSLLAHLRNAIQHQDRVFDCPICTRSCPSARALSTHISSVHSNTKEFACDRCNNKYGSRKSLLRHMTSHDSNADGKCHLNAQCHLCGKNFKGNSKLNRHLKEVCRKDKLEEELSAYHQQEDLINM